MVAVMEPPHLSARMIDIFEVSHAGIVIPDLTPPPGADIKDMVEGGFGNAAVADGQDHLFRMAFHQLLYKQPHPGPEIDERFTPIDERCNR